MRMTFVVQPRGGEDLHNFLQHVNNYHHQNIYFMTEMEKYKKFLFLMAL